MEYYAAVTKRLPLHIDTDIHQVKLFFKVPICFIYKSVHIFKIFEVYASIIFLSKGYTYVYISIWYIQYVYVTIRSVQRNISGRMLKNRLRCLPRAGRTSQRRRGVGSRRVRFLGEATSVEIFVQC